MVPRSILGFPLLVLVLVPSSVADVLVVVVLFAVGLFVVFVVWEDGTPAEERAT